MKEPAAKAGGQGLAFATTFEKLNRLEGNMAFRTRTTLRQSAECRFRFPLRPE
jgi:hypothetical protein